MNKPRAFCELPAGLAAVSLRLHGGPYCRPPISRMGSKQGYAETILAILGLRSGQGADCYVWGESDPDVRGLLRAYPDAALLRRVAAIIRGWSSEEPRALWERLRAERKARGPRVDEEGTAGWLQIEARSSRAGVFLPDHYDDDVRTGWPGNGPPSRELSARCLTLAEYATIAAGNRLINMAGPDLMNTGDGGTRFGGEFATPPADVAAAFERVAGEVAGHAILGQWSYRRGEPDSGFNAGVETGEAWNADAPETARRFEVAAGRWPPVAVLPTIPTAADLAAMLGTPGDLEGVVVYADPDYRGTTGYASTCRDLIPDFARACDALGAVVCISEQEPLPELPGWHAVEITAGRKGQTRTFSKQKAEWLTMNREPAHRVATQSPLFAIGGP